MRSFDLENARRKQDSQNFFQPVKLGFAGLKSNLDRFRSLTHNLQAEEASLKHCASYPEMPRKSPYMAFKIEPPTIGRFELPLDQKVTVITLFVVRKRNLEILTARFSHRNVFEE